jgi:hypothetical protein
MGSFGWKSVSVTHPLCPGSLYKSLLVLTSQTFTVLSLLPAMIFEPSGDQLWEVVNFF